MSLVLLVQSLLVWVLVDVNSFFCDGRKKILEAFLLKEVLVNLQLFILLSFCCYFTLDTLIVKSASMKSLEMK
jgi:hypothetical protein